jgi:hypothetical protein
MRPGLDTCFPTHAIKNKNIAWMGHPAMTLKRHGMAGERAILAAKGVHINTLNSEMILVKAAKFSGFQGK